MKSERTGVVSYFAVAFIYRKGLNNVCVTSQAYVQSKHTPHNGVQLGIEKCTVHSWYLFEFQFKLYTTRFCHPLRERLGVGGWGCWLTQSWIAGIGTIILIGLCVEHYGGGLWVFSFLFGKKFWNMPTIHASSFVDEVRYENKYDRMSQHECTSGWEENESAQDKHVTSRTGFRLAFELCLQTRGTPSLLATCYCDCMISPLHVFPVWCIALTSGQYSLTALDTKSLSCLLLKDYQRSIDPLHNW